MAKSVLIITSLLIGIHCLSINASAQEKELEVKTQINADRSVNFSAEKRLSGTYTLVLNFRELSTANGEPVHKIKNSTSNFLYGISLMLTYLKSVDFEDLINVKESKSFYGFITPYFCTAENLNGILNTQQYYTTVFTPEIIQKEMTKKEIKSLEKK